MVDLDPDRLARAVLRLGSAAQNALEVARFGGLDTGEEPSPFDVVGRTPVYRLRHYFPELGGPAADTGRPPLLLVPPLMLTAEVYDVSPAVSGVAALSELGVDPWVVDFGAPEREEGGLRRTLADHVIAVSDAIERVRRATGTDVHLGGYSQGGMFAYQVCAHRRGEGITSLVTFGSPVDAHRLSPAGLPVDQLADVAAALADVLLSRTSVPAGLSRRVFQLLDPLKTAQQRLQFVLQLHNRDALLAREGSRRFLEHDGWVAWPGPAVAEFASQFLAHNRMLQGGFVIGDRLVSVADIAVPTLAVVGTKDEIAAAPAVRAIRRAAPLADVWELAVPSGHMGLVVGNGARERTWPVVARWVRWHEGDGPRPDAITPMAAPATDEHEDGRADAAAGAQVVAGLAVEAAQVAATTAVGAARAVRGVVGEAFGQLPRLARLQRVEPDTRLSLGLLLAERTRKDPDGTFFLFAGRAYSYADSTYRIDAVTRGLIATGVRQGDHVGVLMRTRPTSLALVAALSRLGAVAVMLRPDGDLARELALAQVTRVVADPDHVAQAAAVPGGPPVLLLGTPGDGEGRPVPPGVVDMEPIDHTAVALPGWFRPDPGRARELAVVTFTGRGEGTRANRITNRRWAVAAYGTASAASLGRADTVYAITPLHHPATLLTAAGGALASGARLALSDAPPDASGRPDPERFWEEVRRYGVTVVAYTWAMAASLVEAPPGAAERHHPVRLFAGSGMPAGLWQRVQDRFRPARVLEFYAPTEGDVVLANLTGDKAGSVGRPLPGTARVVLAAVDPSSGRLLQDDRGLGREAETGEPGLLLARLGADRAAVRGPVLRGVFAPGDAWLSAEDLFTRDAEGDLWLLGPPGSLIPTPAGPVAPPAVERALEGVDAVALAVAYGLRLPGTDHQLVVAAVTARAGAAIAEADLLQALSGLAPEQWPSVVRVVDAIPLTAHHRPRKDPLEAEGLPADAQGFAWDDAEGRYRPLDPALVAELLAAGSGAVG